MSKYWAYTQRNSDGSETAWSRVAYADPVSWERVVGLMQGYAARGGATLTGVRTLSQEEYWSPEVTK